MLKYGYGNKYVTFEGRAGHASYFVAFTKKQNFLRESTYIEA